MTKAASMPEPPPQAEYLIYKEKYSAEGAPTGAAVPNFQVRDGQSVCRSLGSAQYIGGGGERDRER